MKRHNVAPGDFPDLEEYRSKLVEQDFSKFPVLRPKVIEDLESVLGVDIPRLMEALPRSLDSYDVNSAPPTNIPIQFDDMREKWREEGNPFDGPGGGARGEDVWGLEDYIPKYEDAFNEKQRDGKISGAAAKVLLRRSNVENSALRKIWDLADIDKDGQLDKEEFVIAMFLVDMVAEGHPVPEVLDPLMFPASKRKYLNE